MNIAALDLQGAYLIELDRQCDERGFFARAWCRDEFAEAGIEASFVQASVSQTDKKGTIRGMHYQEPPSAEGKLIRCSRGSIYDVVVDIRPGSKTFLKHYGVELGAENGAAVFVPSGFAHGFQTLCDDVQVFYEMTDVYRPGLGNGFRHDDPLLRIDWPLPVSVISSRDANYPDLIAEQLSVFE